MSVNQKRMKRMSCSSTSALTSSAVLGWSIRLMVGENLAEERSTARWRRVDNAAMPSPSYSHGTSETPLLGDTIGAHFQHTAARFADRPALVSRVQDVRMTYGELDAAVDAVAGGLLRAGIRAGDRVGIWAPNCAEWILVQYATAKVGAILVNVNPAYRTHELEYVLRQASIGTL